MDKKAIYFYNQLYTIASLNIYNSKRKHIRLLRLYKLAKKCLKVGF